MKILLLDLGGTHLRAGFSKDFENQILGIKKIKINETESIESSIEDLINEIEPNKIIFSAAGPRKENTIRMTNRDFNIDGNKLSKKFGLECCLLNDWESIGYCVPTLNDHEILEIKESPSNENTSLMAIGPGTGLGCVNIKYKNEEPMVFSTEIGNTRQYNSFLNEHFRLSDEENFDYLEHYISGTGLRKLYFIKTQEDLYPEEILNRYNTDEVCKKLVDDFIEAFYKILSDLALTFLVKERIYLVGGLMRSLCELKAMKEKAENFLNHPSDEHNKILNNCGIYLVKKEHTPLYGNLNYARIRTINE